MSKPKLTEDNIDELYNIAIKSENKGVFIEKIYLRGYTDKPETKLEKADRLFDEWKKQDKDLISIDDVIMNYRIIIAELEDNK